MANYSEIKIMTDKEKLPEAVEFLEQQNALAITFSDAKDDPILEPGVGEFKLWPNTIVTGLFDQSYDLDFLVNKLKAILGDNIPIAVNDLENKDWVRAWMDNFKPLKCANNLYICPSWCTPPDKSAINVILDPGLAFGTGTHPTTFLCLEQIAKYDLHDQMIIDFGCGSGILAISALLLGAKYAYGIDIDPQAIIASKSNSQINHVQDRLYLTNKVLDIKEKTNFLVANILCGPLLELKDTICSLVNIKGTVVLSGLLMEQGVEIIESYQTNFKMISLKEKDGWLVIVMEKQKD